MDLISVIVPVYKVEPYLEQCVSSIINQTYTDLEIILVDDGSPDRCPQICDDWAKRDKRIRVIHQKNAGAGAARNVGIAAATGNILTFVDSDDYIAPQMYKHLIDLLQDDVDIAECGFFRTESGSGHFDVPADQYDIIYAKSEDAMREHILDRLFRQTVCNKLYRRGILEGIMFPVGNLIDDEFWTYRVLGNARKLVHSTCKLYAYRQQEDSVMHITYSLKRLQAVDAKCERLQYIATNFPQLYDVASINLWLTCLYQGQMSLKYLEKDQVDTAFSKLNEAMKQLRFQNVQRKNLRLDYKLWLSISRCSLYFACWIRNRIKIGID